MIQPQRGGWGRKIGLLLIVAGIVMLLMPLLFSFMGSGSGDVVKTTENLIMGWTQMAFYGLAGGMLIFFGLMMIVLSGVSSIFHKVFHGITGSIQAAARGKRNPKCASCGGINLPEADRCKYCESPL